MSTRSPLDPPGLTDPAKLPGSTGSSGLTDPAGLPGSADLTDSFDSPDLSSSPDSSGSPDPTDSPGSLDPPDPSGSANLPGSPDLPGSADSIDSPGSPDPADSSGSLDLPDSSSSANLPGSPDSSGSFNASGSSGSDEPAGAAHADESARAPGAGWRAQLASTLLGVSRHARATRNARKQASAFAAESPHASAHSVWRAVLRNPSALAGLALLLAFTALAVFASQLYPGDPLDMVAAPFEWPGADPAYWLGTDSLGRDVAAGIAHGARVSLLTGVAAAALGLVLGTLVGAVGGFFGGWIDDALVRITELFQTVPSFLLVIVIVAIGHPEVRTIALAIGLASWPTVARIVRAEFRSLRHADFVAAARSQGLGNARIIFGEILPNALPPVVVTASVMVASAILIESSLSFLGMGDPNVVSWGGMIGAGRDSLGTAWYLSALPGTAIVLAVLALNLLGDGLNDALNPRARQRGQTRA